ncbi:MAG TPA: nicotinate-nucleotide--dimethylbenzimidazole phosphoribosyltransferase [Acidimicrobiales bacterium]|nr:nicotinate-nucleotide--dimethylbenzimidazole phosphoribosyltransferase [Acidimicrobiales bacterium]
MTTLEEALSKIGPPDATAAAAARERHRLLASPLGSLEVLGARLAAIAGRCPPPVPSRPVVTVFAADHGVVAEGVSTWSAETTAKTVADILAGGATVNVLAREVEAAVLVIDVGMASEPPTLPATGVETGGARLVRARIRRGTADAVLEPAMSPDDARRALQVGLSLADRLADQGTDLLVTGAVAAGSTTASAALVAAVTGWPARAVTGRGSGVSDEVLENKSAVAERALERAASDRAPTALASLPGEILLSELGGPEIGAAAGVMIGGALRRVPVVVGGLASLAAALVAWRLCPEVPGYLVAGHRSLEPGATAALDHLGLDPLLDLGLGLGDGGGACLAVPLVRAAARVLGESASPGPGLSPPRA